jgi:transcriptional regulator with XRE-family HTH domain
MNKIKEFRIAKNLTIRELSEISKVAPSYISELENDLQGAKNPTKEIMEKIALALESTVPEIFY